jgi:hypothetical protein
MKLSPERVQEIARLADLRDHWARERKGIKAIRTFNSVIQVEPDPSTLMRDGSFPEDRSTWHEVLAVLRRAGWRLAADPDVVKRYGRDFARSYYLGEKGTLGATVELRGMMGVQIDAWSSTPLEIPGRFNNLNPNGPRYDYQKIDRMTHREQLTFRATQQRLVTHFAALGWTHVADPPAFKWARERIEYELRTTGHFDRHYPHGDTDRPCADDAGYNIRDRDGRTVVNGDVRYFYDDATLRRGRVFKSLNNWIIEASPVEVRYMAVHDLFTYVAHPSRRPSEAAIRRHLDRAVAAENFEKACELRDELRRRYPGAKRAA